MTRAMVEKLLALTSSPFEEEARTAAMKACALIQRLGLLGGGGGGPAVDDRELIHLRNKVRVLEDQNRFLCRRVDDLNDELREAQRAQQKPPAQPPMDRPVLLTNKYETYCRSCGEEIQVGTKVNWCRGVGVWHVFCDDPR